MDREAPVGSEAIPMDFESHIHADEEQIAGLPEPTERSCVERSCVALRALAHGPSLPVGREPGG